MPRLPIPGSDDNRWGDILNEYLLQAHKADGTLKSNAVSADAIANNVIGLAHLNASGNPTNGQVLTYNGSGLAWSTVSGGGSVPDADASTKGLIQLTGHLGGTADSPTVPGLATKENTITPGTSAQYFRGDKTWQTLDKSAVGLSNVDNTSDASKPISSATQTALNAKADASATVNLTGNQTVAGVKTFSSSPVVPTPSNNNQAANKEYVDSAVSGLGGLPSGGTTGQVLAKASDTNYDTAWITPSPTSAWEGVLLDSFSGSSDDEKLTNALSYVQSTAGRPAILLGPREYVFNQTRNLFSGLKIVGSLAGPQNMELASSTYVPTRIDLGNTISSGTASWWVPPVGGGDVYDVYMANFAMQGRTGASQHQFLDYPVSTGTLYACEFHALGFDFMRSVFGRKDRKCALTQVVFSGHWTVNNLWDTQFHLGGSDNQLWVGGYVNIGVSQSGAQTGSYADNDYQMIFDGLSKTDIGFIYMSCLNGWRGLKVSGNSMGGLNFFGGVYEGYNSSNNRAPGSVIRLEGGTGTFHGPRIGQAMASPDAAEGGYVHMTGGEWSFLAPKFFRGSTADTVPAIYQSGGRLYVVAAEKANSETWTTRPILDTGASGGNEPSSGTYSTYCPDLSMNVI